MALFILLRKYSNNGIYGIRIVYKSVLASMVTILLYSSYLVINILLFGKKNGLKQRWRACIVRCWGKSMLCILHAKIMLTGYPPQKQPVVLVSNHLGYIDILLYCALLHPVFVAKSDVASWPVIGQLCRSFSVLFINRHSVRQSYQLQKKLYQKYQEGYPIVFFPEGTSTNGDTVKPFKTLLFKWLAEQQIPVHYALLHYQAPTGYDAGEDICWWRSESKLIPHLLRLLSMPQFCIKIHFSSKPLLHQNHRILAQKTHQAITNLQVAGLQQKQPS